MLLKVLKDFNSMLYYYSVFGQASNQNKLIFGNYPITRKTMYFPSRATFRTTNSLHAFYRSVHTSGNTLNAEVGKKMPRLFQEIPGPTRYPVLGTTMDMLKSGGPTKYTENVKKNFKLYGPIYREVIPGIPGKIMVNVANPEAAEKVFRSEGRYPERVGFDFMGVYYREKKIRPFGIQLQGEQWFNSRQLLAPKMMIPKAVEQSMNDFNDVTNDAMIRMKALRPPNGHFPNIEDEVFRFSMEASALYTIGVRIGLLSASADEKVFEFMNAGKLFFDQLAKLLFSFPAYRYISTPTWKTFCSTLDTIRRIGRTFVDARIAELEKSPEEKGPSLLDYLRDKDVNPEDILTICIFQLLGGVDTTGYTIVWVMYHLAKNPLVQEQLYEELSTVLKGEEPSTKLLSQMPFLKACVKESQRLCPLATVLTRVLKKDVELLGYHIPKNTWINVHNYGMSLQCFKDPEGYNPQRWLRGSGDKIKPFSFLPFSHGPRQCIGRRVAELEIYIYIIKLLQLFKLKHHGETGMKFKLGIYPEKPMNFELELR